MARSAARLLGLLLLLCGAALPIAPIPAVAQCRVIGEAPAADLQRARAACARASERFTLLFGGTAPPGIVEVSDTVLFFAIENAAPEWKLIWPTTARIREFFGGEGRGGGGRGTGGVTGPATDPAVEQEVQTHWHAVLPHEIGHLMLDAEADARRPRSAPRTRLADWFHEGTAVWLELPIHRASGYAIVRALRPYVPPLHELTTLTIAHTPDQGAGGSTIVRTFYPCASEEACAGRPHWSRIFQVTTRHLPDGTMQVDTTFLDQAPPPPDPVASNFYTYSATLVRYLFDRGGASAMSALLDRYMGPGIGGGDERPAGVAALVGLPGLPAQRSRLEADWRGWFERYILHHQ